MFLGYDMSIQLVLSSEYDDYDKLRSFHHVPINITDYKICNILCLNHRRCGTGGAGGAIVSPLFSLTLLTDQKPFIIPF